jgi:calcium-dependent secretion activator
MDFQHVYRTETSFQSWLKKGFTLNSTDYIVASEMCGMINVILDAKNQSFKLCAVDGVDVVSQQRNTNTI